jgi:hypothetical protein
MGWGWLLLLVLNFLSVLLLYEVACVGGWVCAKAGTNASPHASMMPVGWAGWRLLWRV